VQRRRLKHCDDPVNVGRRLRAARDAAGLTQRDVADVGCTVAYVSLIEKGTRVPSLQLLRAFAERLGVSEQYLAYGEHDRHPRPSTLAEARVATRLGDLEVARELAEAALTGARSDAERARVSAVFGEIELRAGRYREAIDAIELARRLDHAGAGDDPAAADSLGRAYARLLEYESSIAVFAQARLRAEAAGDALNEVRFASLLAHAYSDSGNFAAAEEALGAALRVSAEAGDPLARARVLWAQSRLHGLQNDPATAAIYAERALEILEVSDYDYYAALAHQLLAHIELDRGNGERAVELLERAGPLIIASGRNYERATFEVERARALLLLGRREEAAAIAMEASALMRGESSVDAGRCYMLVADVFQALDDDPRAVELYELAVEHLRATPNRYLVEAYAKLAELYERIGDQGRALAVLKDAMKVQTQADRMLTPRS